MGVSDDNKYYPSLAEEVFLKAEDMREVE